MTQSKPSLVIKAIDGWREFVLRALGKILGFKGEAFVVYIAFDNDEEIEPTINDLKKNQEEDEMNNQNRKEAGE